jgi:hypothetical protein
MNEGSSVEPDHDRTLRGIESLRPDIEDETVLACGTAFEGVPGSGIDEIEQISPARPRVSANVRLGSNLPEHRGVSHA